MKTASTKAKSSKIAKPFDVVKVGSISIPIYSHTNIIPHRQPQTGAFLYETLPDAKLKRVALLKARELVETRAVANHGFVGSTRGFSQASTVFGQSYFRFVSHSSPN